MTSTSKCFSSLCTAALSIVAIIKQLNLTSICHDTFGKWLKYGLRVAGIGSSLSLSQVQHFPRTHFLMEPNPAKTAVLSQRKKRICFGLHSGTGVCNNFQLFLPIFCHGAVDVLPAGEGTFCTTRESTKLKMRLGTHMPCGHFESPFILHSTPLKSKCLVCPTWQKLEDS